MHLPVDGPLNRLRQLYEHQVYHETLHEFLNERLDFHKWQHCLRERFRLAWWKKIARERSQHFAGIANGVNRRATTAYLKILEKEADKLQYQLDNQVIASVDPDIDPRPKLKLLRLLLSADLQTPERDHRHRKRPGSIKCTCGQGSPTIYHISWECSCFQEIRQDIWAYMPQPVHDLPTCFQLTTLVPVDMNIATDQVIEIQKIMVKIWQKHVQMWYNDTSEPPSNPNPNLSNQPASSTDICQDNPPENPNLNNSLPVKRGHVLKLIPAGGVFCCRCGKQTKNMKHQRLKILSKPCRYPDLEPSKWLTVPGFIHSETRLLDLESTLNEKYNPGNHQLVWNRKLGKIKNATDYGLLWCASCGKSWPWARRMTTLTETVCHPSSTKPNAPDWVTILDH